MFVSRCCNFTIKHLFIIIVFNISQRNPKSLDKDEINENTKHSSIFFRFFILVFLFSVLTVSCGPPPPPVPSPMYTL